MTTATAGAGKGTTDPAASSTTTTDPATTTTTAAAATGEAAAAATTDGKTPAQIAADQASADTTTTAAATTAAAAAPTTYSLTLPEGSVLDASDVARVETVARAQGLTNEAAQAILDGHAAELSAQSTRFLAETQADPVYGGTHLEQTQTRARAALERLRPAGTPQGDALRALLDKSGYGNHLAVISLLADIGAQMAEDSPVLGRAAGVPVDPATVLYGGTAAAKASA